VPGGGGAIERRVAIGRRRMHILHLEKTIRWNKTRTLLLSKRAAHFVCAAVAHPTSKQPLWADCERPSPSRRENTRTSPRRHRRCRAAASCHVIRKKYPSTYKCAIVRRPPLAREPGRLGPAKVQNSSSAPLCLPSARPRGDPHTPHDALLALCADSSASAGRHAQAGGPNCCLRVGKKLATTEQEKCASPSCGCTQSRPAAASRPPRRR